MRKSVYMGRDYESYRHFKAMARSHEFTAARLMKMVDDPKLYDLRPAQVKQIRRAMAILHERRDRFNERAAKIGGTHGIDEMTVRHEDPDALRAERGLPARRGSRASGTNPRALGTNPRAMGG